MPNAAPGPSHTGGWFVSADGGSSSLAAQTPDTGGNSWSVPSPAASEGAENPDWRLRGPFRGPAIRTLGSVQTWAPIHGGCTPLTSPEPGCLPGF